MMLDGPGAKEESGAHVSHSLLRILPLYRFVLYRFHHNY